MHYDEKNERLQDNKEVHSIDLIAQVRFNAFSAGMKYESFHKIVNCKICTSLHF